MTYRAHLLLNADFLVVGCFVCLIDDAKLALSNKAANVRLGCPTLLGTESDMKLHGDNVVLDHQRCHLDHKRIFVIPIGHTVLRSRCVQGAPTSSRCVAEVSRVYHLVDKVWSKKLIHNDDLLLDRRNRLLEQTKLYCFLHVLFDFIFRLLERALAYDIRVKMLFADQHRELIVASLRIQIVEQRDETKRMGRLVKARKRRWVGAGGAAAHWWFSELSCVKEKSISI